MWRLIVLRPDFGDDSINGVRVGMESQRSTPTNCLKQRVWVVTCSDVIDFGSLVDVQFIAIIAGLDQQPLTGLGSGLQQQREFGISAVGLHDVPKSCSIHDVIRPPGCAMTPWGMA